MTSFVGRTTICTAADARPGALIQSRTPFRAGDHAAWDAVRRLRDRLDAEAAMADLEAKMLAVKTAELALDQAEYELANPFALSSRLRRAVRHGAHPGGLQCVEEAIPALRATGSAAASTLAAVLEEMFEGRRSALSCGAVMLAAAARLQELGG